MAYNQQLSVLGQVAPATTGTAGQVLVSAGNSASSYWASAIPVSAYSAQFSGSNYLSTTAVSLLGDFTIECWARFTTFSAATYGGSLVSQGAVTTISPNVMSLQIETGGNLRFFWADLNAPVLSGPTVSLNTWYHVAVTKSGSSFTMWVNGVSSATGTSSSTMTATNLFYVGTAHYGPGLTTRSMTGYVSNVRVTNGVAIYTGAFTPPTSPLGTAQGAGTNIAAVSSSQVVLLTCNGPGFTDSSSNALAITNNGNAVTSQFAPFSSFSAIARSATQTQTILTSGSGTYYTPSGVAWLRVRMVGGGGGGKGGHTGGAGGNGANTTFGTSFLVAGGGLGSTDIGSYTAGTGGTASGGLINLQGAMGGTGAQQVWTGGSGGVSPFGGAGAGGWNGVAGYAAITNTGSGGGGGGVNATVNAGGGGGAGGYVEGYISSPAASYAYTIGTGGGGGTSGGNGYAGGGGGSGIIIVEENYAVSVSQSNYVASYLIVAGGGGGASDTNTSWLGGGGGAGGMLTGTTPLIMGTAYTFIVGSGGAGTTGLQGTNGVNSVAFGFTAIGGGGGGTTVAGNSGGSGGGGSGGAGAASGGSGTSGQGFAGGTGSASSPGYGGGGGGGAGAVGSNGSSSAGGAGGIGLASSITGASVYYAGGGGGGGIGTNTGGAGGNGGGGAGGAQNGTTTGTSGTANLGGGGGGTYTAAPGSGGSGVVILSIPNFNYSGITTGSPTVTTSGNYKILTFTQSGSYTA